MGIRARVFLIVFFSLAVSIRIAYVIAERDITSTFEEQTIYQLEKQAQLLLVNVDDVSKYGDIKAADLVADKLGNASNSRVTLILNNGVVVGDSDVELESIAIDSNSTSESPTTTPLLRMRVTLELEALPNLSATKSAALMSPYLLTSSTLTKSNCACFSN